MANKTHDTDTDKSIYGFYGAFKESFPSQAIVDVTEVCNLSCIHCAHGRFKKSGHYSGCFLNPNLSGGAAELPGR